MNLKDIKYKIAQFLLKDKNEESINKEEINLEDLNKNTREQFLSAINKFSIVNVVFKSCFPEVEIPEKLKNDDFTVLQFGRGLANPIKDFLADEKGITATLSFLLTLKIPEYKCFIPWASIIAIAEGRPNPPQGGTPVAAKNILVFDNRERMAA